MNSPVRELKYGHSSHYGQYFYASLGSQIQFKDDAGKMRRWGDIDTKIDWRQIRGEAGGIEMKYGWQGYSGYLDSYFLHDLGRNPSNAFDAQFPPLSHPDRGKAHWYHRQEIDEHWRYELEVNYITDGSLLQEFFQAEFQLAKEPESAAYVRWLDGDAGAYVLGRFRLNSFQTEDEYLPRSDVNLLSHPILPGFMDNLYLTERVDTVDIRRQFDKGLAMASVDTWRLDALTKVTLPFEFRYFQFAPLIQNRLTYFEDDLAGNSRLRDIWTAGARLTTQLHSTHPDLSWERIVILRGVNRRDLETAIDHIDVRTLVRWFRGVQGT